MRKLTLALGMAAATFIGTATATAAQAADVAVVDWQQALLDTNAAKQSMNQLKNKLGNRPQQLQTMGQELQQMQQRLQRDGATMSESARNQQVQQFQTKGAEFQKLRAQLEEERQTQEDQFLRSARPRLDAAIKQVVQRHGVKVLVDRTGVIYADDALDLTGEVTQAYNTAK